MPKKELQVDIGEGFQIGKDPYNWVLMHPMEMQQDSKKQSYSRSYHPDLKSLISRLIGDNLKNDMGDISFKPNENKSSVNNFYSVLDRLSVVMEDKIEKILEEG